MNEILSWTEKASVQPDGPLKQPSDKSEDNHINYKFQESIIIFYERLGGIDAWEESPPCPP
jgi:hypothetical protein